MSVVANRRSVMSCFSSPTDPECHRARIVLAEKDITVEIHDVDTNNLPEDLLDLNPYATVPTMVDRDLVPHNALIDRFRLAVDWFSMDARAVEIPRYVKNLHRVERDIYAIEETVVELPGWV